VYKCFYQTEPSDSDGGGSNVGVIAGIITGTIVGVIVIIIILAAVIYYQYNKGT